MLIFFATPTLQFGKLRLGAAILAAKKYVSQSILKEFTTEPQRTQR
jgi:hypothetical protein